MKEVRIKIKIQDIDFGKLTTKLGIPLLGENVDYNHIIYDPRTNELVVYNQTKKDVENALQVSEVDVPVVVSTKKRVLIDIVTKKAISSMQNFMSNTVIPNIDSNILLEVIDESADFLSREGNPVSKYPLLEMYSNVLGYGDAKKLAKKILKLKSEWIQFSVNLERVRLTLINELNNKNTIDQLIKFEQDIPEQL